MGVIVNNIILRFSSNSGTNMWWTYGSSTAVFMVFQVLTGLLLSIYVVMLSLISFDVILMHSVEVNGHEYLRYLHANSCSVVFMVMLIHVGKGVWISSFHKGNLWKSGVTLLILVIGAAFLGYVLPWGNISLWGATVITNLLSVLPGGGMILLNVWSSFTLNDATLSRMFSLHFLLPLAVVGLIIVHLMLLHEYVSSSSVVNNITIGMFAVLFTKDVFVWITCLVLLGMMVIIPQYFLDADNWGEANFIVTPDHINPEWYFLFAYAILRCIPVKWVGVISLVSSLLIILVIGMMNGLQFILIFLINFLLLTMLSGVEVTNYYTYSSQLSSVLYIIFI